MVSDLEEHLGGVGVQVGLGGAVQGAQRAGQLAQANLATSLNNLATQQANAGQPEGALDAFDTAWADLAPGPRAELMVTRSRWRASQDDRTGATADLRAAATQADQETDAPRAGRSRRTVAAAAQELLGPNAATQSLPEWARHPLPDDLAATLNDWLARPAGLRAKPCFARTLSWDPQLAAKRCSSSGRSTPKSSRSSS